ncbi:MAG: penicillin-binding protein 1A [Flammeovirgaceae bacterium]|jgi:penicillin-binding protein 1A
MYRKASKTIWILFFSGLVFTAIYITSIYFNWFDLYGGMPPLKQLENPKNELASQLYSEDGVLLGKYFHENRTPVEYSNLSPNLTNALLATEDVRFYEHSGIDMTGTIAIVWYLIKGDDRGSSTVSQQLAKNLFRTRDGYKGKLTGLPNRVSTKFKEWMLAIQIERSYTKNEIMTMYLNTVNFGRNTFGIKVASEVYFGTTPDSLNVQEAAVLVGLLKAPTKYNPINNPKPEEALRRRNTVLNQMEKYGYLTEVECDSIKELEIDISKYAVEDHNEGLATYFRIVVSNYLNKWCEARGLDLYSDGLKVYTTINAKMQAHAENAMEKHMKEQQAKFSKEIKNKMPWRDKWGREMKDMLDRSIKKTEHHRVLKLKYGNNFEAIKKEMSKSHKMTVFDWNSEGYSKDTTMTSIDSLIYYKKFLHSGMMSMNPHNGHIKTWVGGLNHRFFKYDHVNINSRRQPGSTFKPVVYATAIDKAAQEPCGSVQDIPITFQNPSDPSKPWTPKNSDGYSLETYTIRQALARSINTAAAAMIYRLSGGDNTGVIGAEKVVKTARNLGIKAKLDAVPAIALGSNDVSIYELVGAYSAFVNNGVWTEPIFITKIEDKNGKVLHEFVPQKKEAMREETAYKMVYMLMGGLRESGGTSLGLGRYDFIKDNDIGGKTGTTSNNSDAWYMGISKDLVTGVWSGGDDRSIHFRSTRNGQGARQAMPAYAYFMESIYKDNEIGMEKGRFPRPQSIKSNEFDCELRNPDFGSNNDSSLIYTESGDDMN